MPRSLPGRSARAGVGRLADAAATAEKLLNLDPKDGGNLYLAAGIDAICSADVATANHSQRSLIRRLCKNATRPARWSY